MGTFELVLIFSLIAVNSVFAAYEMALASVKPARLAFLAEQRAPGARAAKAMRDRMEGSLAVVQLGITLCGALAAAVGGAGAEEQFAPWLEQRFALSPKVADALAIVFLVIPLAALTIIVGELIPKAFAIRNAERVVLLLSPFMQVLSIIGRPAVVLLEAPTRAVLRLFDRSGDPPGQAGAGLHELRVQVGLLRAGRVIGEKEEQIILAASRLQSRRLEDVMVEVDDIVMLDADGPLTRSIVAAHLDLHTRFPVAERPGDPQTIVGFVNFKEMMLLAKTHPGNPTLRQIVRPMPRLRANQPVGAALRELIAKHTHLALIEDDQRRIVGMLTLEDIFEELVGDIEDELDRLPRYLTPSGRQWVVGGGIPLGRLRVALDRPELGAKFSSETTVSAWLEDALDHAPKGGDPVCLDGIHALIRKVRRKRVVEAVLDPSGPIVVPSA